MAVIGGCSCGAVRFEVSLPVKWCSHCHCHQCQRAHGAAFVTWFGVESDAFQLLSGEPDLCWYESSEQAERGFCGRCGSPMLFRSKRWPGETHVALAAMDGDIDRLPTAHVFWDRHVQWLELGDDLKRLGGESGTEPI